MHAKQLITTLLLLFVVGSVAYMFGRQAGSSRRAEPTSAVDRQPVEQPAEPADNDTKLIVYYFHGNQRCITCEKLEGYARQSLETHFADELASGKIRWQPVNVDTPENTHFVEDYGLVTKSVILSRVADGEEVEFRNLDQIWNLVKDRDRYIEYIHRQTADFLEKEPS